MKAKLLFGLTIVVGLGTLNAWSDEPKFRVKIQDDKAVIVDVEGGAPVDPTQRIKFQSQGNFFANITTPQNQPLHLSHFPNFMIDGRLVMRDGVVTSVNEVAVRRQAQINADNLARRSGSDKFKKRPWRSMTI